MKSTRQPCESAGCDSTTSGFDFHSASVPSTQPDRTVHTSHFPIEHSDSTLEKSDIDRSSRIDFSTVNPDMVSPDELSSSTEKKQDLSFPPSFQSQSRTAPPAYNDLASDLGSNNVQSYAAAIPHLATGQERAMDKLSGVYGLPVHILGEKTLNELSLRLDPDMHPAANWKLMAECMDFSNYERKHFETRDRPTKAVIEAWSRMGKHTVGDLINIINQELNRPDVITDIPDLILKDASRHHRSLQRSLNSDSALFRHTSNEMQSNSFPYGTPPPGSVTMHSFPSFHSQYSYPSLTSPISFGGQFEEKAVAPNMSRPVQVREVAQSAQEKEYDAFVLCSMADKDFVVNQFLPKVEDNAKLKLCFAERDLPPGKLTYHQQMDYMFQRSRKLIVILSDDFFESREHDWQSNLAICQDPAARTQHIIPVKYKKISNPNIFDYLGCCDLTKTMKEEWFWNKIIKGIKA